MYERLILMSERWAMGPGQASLSLSRFTVGGQISSHEYQLYDRKIASHGPWAGLSSFPFHCWRKIRTSQVFYTFGHLMPEMAHIQGLDGTPRHHPFHWPARKCVTFPEQFLSRKGRFDKTRKRH